MPRPPIPTAVVPSVDATPLSTRALRAQFRGILAEGAKLVVVGRSKEDPAQLAADHPPTWLLELFGYRIFVAAPRQIPVLRFFPVYVMPPSRGRGAPKLYARIFYKDLSLMWRAASHLIDQGDEFWIGKGAVQRIPHGEYDLITSLEASTDLPLEIQTALEVLNQSVGRVRTDERLLGRVLQNAPIGRVRPYADFTRPRARAAADPRNLPNRGRPIATFRKANDPSSLRLARGYEPDFEGGVVEESESRSTMYDGRVGRYRILSRNRRVQYFFFASAKHVWLAPPQTLGTELSSFALRTITVGVHDDLCVPGYEYHYFSEDVPESEHFSQIPPGFAGEPSAYNTDRADARKWLDALPIVQDFRRVVLGRR